MEAERSVAVRALAGELLQMMLPALLKMSNTAVRRSLEDDQVRTRHPTHTLSWTFDHESDVHISTANLMRYVQLSTKFSGPLPSGLGECLQTQDGRQPGMTCDTTLEKVHHVGQVNLATLKQQAFLTLQHVPAKQCRHAHSTSCFDVRSALGACVHTKTQAIM